MATPDFDEQRKKIQKIRKEAAAAQSANFSRIMNLDVKVDKDGTRATVILPGLSYDDFDRTGNISAFKISRIAELSRHPLHPLPGIKLLFSGENAHPVVVAQTLTFNRCFYKQAQLHFPFHYITALGYFTKKTCSLSIKAQKHTGEIYWDAELHLTRLDPKRGSAVPYEDDVVEAAARYVTKPKSKLPEPPPAPPGDQVYTTIVKVRFNDTDQLFHVNQAAFILYCIESATEACMAGFLTGFHGDLAWYHVEKIYIRYYSEAFAGDELSVHTWQSKEDTNTLYFNIKKQGKLICVCVFIYYPAEPDNKL